MAGARHISEFVELLIFDGSEDFILEKNNVTYKAKLGEFNKYLPTVSDAAALTGSEEVKITQSGSGVKTTVSNIMSYNGFSDYAGPVDGTETVLVTKGSTRSKATVSLLNGFQKYGKMVTNAAATGTVTLDLSSADLFNLTLTGNATIAISNAPTTYPFTFLIRMKQGGSGSYTLTWSSGFKHPNATPEVIGTAVGDVEWFTCECVESGSIEVFKANGPFK